MSLRLILRSDGIIQRYHIRRRNLRKYESSLALSKFHGIRRERRVYSRIQAIQKPAERPKLVDSKRYENVVSMSFDAPVVGELNQLHVQLTIHKGGKVAYGIDGWSSKHMFPQGYRQAYDEAVMSALSNSPFDGYCDYWECTSKDYRIIVDKSQWKSYK